MSAIIQPGALAPDFTLPAGPDRRVKLSELRGNPVVLAFYPADFSPVCTDQLSVYQTAKPVFDGYRAQLLGISVDGVWCHQAFAQERHLEFPLLSDFEPKGAVSREYGVYDDAVGESSRGLVVIDEDGRVTWSHLSPAEVNPGADGILNALEAMT